MPPRCIELCSLPKNLCRYESRLRRIWQKSCTTETRPGVAADCKE